MDDVDLRLVALLRGNARASWAELGRAVGLAVSAVVGVYQREGIEQDAMIGALRAVAAIEDCWHVAGEEELLVRVRVPDVAALEATLSALRRVSGVSRTRTTVILSAAWEGRFPLALPTGPPPGLPGDGADGDDDGADVDLTG